MNHCIKKTLALALAFIMLFSMTALPVSVGASAVEKTGKSDAKAVSLQRSFGDSIPLDVECGVKDGADSASAKKSLKLAATGAEDESAFEKPYVEGDAFVNFKGEFNFDGFDERITVKETKTFAKGTSLERNYAIVHSDTMTTMEIIDSFSDNEYVDYVTPNTISHSTALTNDTYASFQWALENTGQNNGTSGIDVNPQNLWAKLSSMTKECVVAIIDTGVDSSHEDLKSVLWKNTYHELEGYGYCGYDFSKSVSTGEPRDDDGHGTHIAGIIAAQANNSLGISGINKSSVKIMALRVQVNERDKNGEIESYYDEAAILDAFDYIIRAKELGVNIVAVNCSYGGPGLRSEIEEYNTLCDSLGKMGIITCIASGNEWSNVDESFYINGAGPFYISPAACESKYAITVGATAEDGFPTGFSNYGENVDISAPGNSILSSVNVNTYNPTLYNSTKLSQTTKYYQGFDTSISSNELFGHIDMYRSYYSPEIELISDIFFGTSGDSCMISTGSGMNGKAVLFSVPFSLNSSTASYDITLSIRGTKPNWNENCVFFLLDKPEANDALDAAQLVGYHPTYDWNVLHIHVDPYKTEDYERATNRDLVFAIVPKTNDDCIVFIDGIGISKQNIDSSLYGKYDYYQGTSMAAPYVAGAVALLSSAFPSNSANDKINAIYNSARHLTQLDGEIKGGKFLDLNNAASYMPAAPTVIDPTGVKVDPTTATIEIGEKKQLTATVSPSNATNKTVTWSSSNDSVAKVSSTGEITGKAVGTANIIAKTSNGLTAKCAVTVKANQIPPTGISVSPTSATIEVGATKKLTATVSPSTATNKSVTWVTSDSKIAEVSSDGVVTGKAVGTATITAKTVNNLTATAKITVEAGVILPSGITVSPTSDTIQVGKTVTLKATVSPTNATDKTVRWSSSAENIAKVSGSGIVTGVSAGTATITAKTTNGLKAVATITVTSSTIAPTGIQLEPETAMIGVSEKLTLTATVLPANATDKSVRWTSSDSTIAAVSSYGVVTGKSVGTVTITARTSNGKSATCRITVKSDPVRVYMNNIRQIKKYIDTKYGFYDQDGKNIKVNYRYSDGRYGSVYLILTDDNVLMFYLIATFNDSLTIHNYFTYDISESFDIMPTLLVYQDDELIFESVAAINARTYDPEVGTSAIYDRETLRKITDQDAVELANAVLDVGFYEIGDCMGYMTGFELGDIGFDHLSKLGEYNPALYQRGDYDKDGDISILDATRIQFMLSDQVYVPEDDFLEGIDSDGDGSLTILDATRIQRFLAELCNMDGSTPVRRGYSATRNDAADPNSVDGNSILTDYEDQTIIKNKQKAARIEELYSYIEKYSLNQ